MTSQRSPVAIRCAMAAGVAARASSRRRAWRGIARFAATSCGRASRFSYVCKVAACSQDRHAILMTVC